VNADEYEEKFRRSDARNRVVMSYVGVLLFIIWLLGVLVYEGLTHLFWFDLFKEHGL
jgi:hypothetical protein